MATRRSRAQIKTPLQYQHGIKIIKNENMCLITTQRYTHCLCNTTHITICPGLINKYQLFSNKQIHDVGEQQVNGCRFKQDDRASLEDPCGNARCLLSLGTVRTDWVIGEKDMNHALIAKRNTLHGQNNASTASVNPLGDRIKLGGRRNQRM